MPNAKNSIATVGTIVLLVAGGAAIAGDTTNLDPKADALLKKMSNYMVGLKSFSTDAHVVDEQIMGDGFKLSLLQSGSIKLQRPNLLYMARKGMVQNKEVFFDGSTLVFHGRHIGMSVEMPVTGDVEAALNAFTETFGVELAGRDLLGVDFYTPLMEPVVESLYLGTVEIGDVSCHQLAFRTEEVDWQLWVEEGERPLPCRYTITSKWTHAAPQYTMTFTNWQMNPDFSDGDFTFTAPDGTKSVTAEEFRKALEK